MVFVHTTSLQKVAQKTAEFIREHLNSYLSQGPSLLLLSGGSVAQDVVPVLIPLLDQLSSLKNLHIALVDERFGMPLHENSNQLLLKHAGLWDFAHEKGIKIVTPLTLETKDFKILKQVENDNFSLEKVTDIYNHQLTELFSAAEGRIIALLGIGEDGHTAGIKPLANSEVYRQVFVTEKLVVGYAHIDFERITLTPHGIELVTMIVVYANGEKKRPALVKLLSGQAEEIYKYPSLVLQKHLQTHVFTDQELTTRKS